MGGLKKAISTTRVILTAFILNEGKEARAESKPATGGEIPVMDFFFVCLFFAALLKRDSNTGVFL